MVFRVATLWKHRHSYGSRGMSNFFFLKNLPGVLDLGIVSFEQGCLFSWRALSLPCYCCWAS